MVTILFVLILASDMAVLYGNDAFSVLQFFEKGFGFTEICLNVKVLKKFKSFTDCHRKTCPSLKRRAILIIGSIVFRRTYALSVGFKMKPLTKSVV